MPEARARSINAPVSTVASIKPFCSAAKRSRLPPARSNVTLLSSMPQCLSAVATTI